MNEGAPWAVLAFALLTAGGYPYARWLDLRGPLLPAGAWLLGCGLAGAVMLGLSAAHVPFSRLSLAASWLPATVAGAVLWRRGGPATRRDPNTASGAPAMDLFTVISLGLCCFQIISVSFAAMRVPLDSFDGWALWDYKGLRFYHDAAVSAGFLTDRAALFAHPAYPPLLPLLMAWVYTWCGQTDPVLMKPLFPLFYAALLLGFAACLRTSFAWRTALLGTVCLALMPRITDYAPTALADVPLAAYLVAAASLVSAAWRGDSGQRMLAAGGVFAGIAACTKHEGLVFLATLLVVLPALRLPWRRGGLAVGVAGAIALPWYVYAAYLRVPDRDFLSVTPANLLRHLDRVPTLAGMFGLNMLSLAEWGLLWLAVAAALARCLAGRRPRLPALLAAAALPLLVYILMLSLSAWPDYLQHARTSLDRLLLVTVPFALWWLLAQFIPLEEPGPSAGIAQTATDS